MPKTSQDGDLDTNVSDTSEAEVQQDQSPIGTLEDAANLLSDDDLTEEQPEPEQTGEQDAEGEGEETAETEGDEFEGDEGEDLEAGEDGPTIDVMGEQLPAAEVAKGYLRQEDYTRKAEALSEDRKFLDQERETVEQTAQQLQTAYQNLGAFLQTVTADPPAELATTNPTAYLEQQAAAQELRQTLSTVLADGQQVEQTVHEFSDSDKRRLFEHEDAKLLRALPGLKEPGRRAVFDKNIKATALEFGFSEAEIEQTADARIRHLVHFARLGKLAQTNRKNAKRRIAGKPTEGKAKPSAQPSNSTGKSKKAMERLKKSGSMKDALQVDFA